MQKSNLWKTGKQSWKRTWAQANLDLITSNSKAKTCLWCLCLYRITNSKTCHSPKPQPSPKPYPPHQLLKCNWTHVSHILRIECISVLMLCLKTFEPLSLSLSWPVDTPGSLTHAFRSPAYPWEPTAAQWQRNLWYVKELRLLQLVWYGTMSLIYNCIIKLVWRRIPFYAFGYLNNSSFLALSISVQIRPGCPQWMLASQTLSVSWPWLLHHVATLIRNSKWTLWKCPMWR